MPEDSEKEVGETKEQRTKTYGSDPSNQESPSKQGSETILRMADMDPTLKYELSKIPGAEKLLLCLQCGTCTGDCPVSSRVPEFSPRTIAKMAALGMKDALFTGDLLWLCAQCYTCYEECPEDVKPSEIISALRKMAVKEGHIHPAYKSQMELIGTLGRLYDVSEIQNEMRAELGLPPVPDSGVNEVKKIMKRTGLDKLTQIDLSKEG